MTALCRLALYRAPARRCAWCAVLLAPGSGPASHGICSTFKARHFGPDPEDMRREADRLREAACRCGEDDRADLRRERAAGPQVPLSTPHTADPRRGRSSWAALSRWKNPG